MKKKKVTIVEVAREAGVSIATVSRVINKSGKVEKKSSERVFRAIEKLQYKPNIHARRIRGETGKTLAIILPSMIDNFFSQVLEGVLKAAFDSEIKILTYSCRGNTELEEDCLKSASLSGIDGLLYCPTSSFSSEKLFEIFSKDFPMVILYRRNLVKGIPHIYHDNIGGGYQATKFLIRQGHRHIVFFISFWNSPFQSIDEILDFMDNPGRGCYSSLDRLEGHIKALSEAGIDFENSMMFTSGYDFESGYAMAKEFLSTMRDFDSIICGNDSVAAGVIQALREQNISIPEQVSVIGYDDSVFATITRPQLTSVRQEPYRMGIASVEMMLRILEGEKLNDQIIDSHLVVRNSTSMRN